MSCTIDASVHVSSLRLTDVHHAKSIEFFAEMAKESLTAYDPLLVLAECAGAMKRTTGDLTFALAAVESIRKTPNSVLIPMTETRAERAAEIAAIHSIRGADAVYVQVAEETGSTLITWDAEILTRSAPIVTTLTPAD